MAQTFEERVSSVLDDLYSAALCFTQDAHQAEELLQESAIRGFHEYRHRTETPDFKGWMLELLVSSYLLRERRRGRALFTDAVESQFGDPDPEPITQAAVFPEQGSAAHARVTSWLASAWRDVEPGDRLVLWLAVVERLLHSRIAELVGLAEEQVRRRHYRARLALGKAAARELGRREPRSRRA